MSEEKSTKLCSNCGAEIDIKAEICPKCGVRQPLIPEKVSNWWYLPSFFLGIFGGLIAWVANKDHDPKKARRFLIVGLILPLVWVIFAFIIIPMSLGGARGKARDARRKSDLRQINLAMEMTYDYGTEEHLRSETMPTAIGDYLDPVPTDPGGGPCSSYKWISNSSNPKKYCAWACLESGEFFAVNEKGNKTLDKAPTSLNCW